MLTDGMLSEVRSVEPAAASDLEGGMQHQYNHRSEVLYLLA